MTNTDSGGLYPLGRMLGPDGNPTKEPVWVAEDWLCKHSVITGASGAGKSTYLGGAVIQLADACDGASIVIAPKDGALKTELLRSWYGTRGSLDSVYEFGPDRLPAISFFDLRPYLNAGLPRPEAITRVADQYLTVARFAAEGDTYERSITASKIIRALITALFDPNHGADVFAHKQLYKLLTRLTHGDPPPISDGYETAQRELEDITARSKDERERELNAVKNRLQSVASRPHVKLIMNHVPAGATAAPQASHSAAAEGPAGEAAAATIDAVDSDTHFPLRQRLNEDCLIVIETSRLKEQTQEMVSMVLFSKVWDALELRKETTTLADPPVVNLVLDEAAMYRDLDAFETLLKEGRGYNVELTLATQSVEQLADNSQSTDPEDELLNNVATLITGPIRKPDEPLLRRLEDSSMSAREIRHRLGNLPGGQALTKIGSKYDETTIGPFQVALPDPPPGHPVSDYPLAKLGLEENFRTAHEHRQQTLDDTATIRLSAAVDADSETAATAETATDHAVEADLGLHRGSLLPRTDRLPEPVEYLEARHRLACASCGDDDDGTRRTYPPTLDGLFRAVECCHHREAIDSDAVPIVECQVPLTPGERLAADLSPSQAAFLSLVFTVQYGHHDTRAFNLVTDSMTLLRDYAGITTTEVDDLCERGLLTVDGRQPHLVYSVTAAGRDVLQLSLREGVDFGDRIGDLGESSLHRLGVGLAVRYLTATYANDPESAVETVVPYYPLADDTRLDVAGLTSDGTVEVAVEVERDNNDHNPGAVEDYDKLTIAEEALWIVEDRACAESVVAALADPNEGEPRVETTYSSTPPHQYTIDQPGLTQMETITRLHNQLPFESPAGADDS